MYSNFFFFFLSWQQPLLWNSLAIIYSGSIVCLKVLHLPDYRRKPAEEASGVWAFLLLWCLIKPAAKKTQRGGEITDATCLSLELNEALRGNSIKTRPSTERGRGKKLLQTTISLKPILTKTHQLCVVKHSGFPPPPFFHFLDIPHSLVPKGIMMSVSTSIWTINKVIHIMCNCRHYIKDIENYITTWWGHNVSASSSQMREARNYTKQGKDSVPPPPRSPGPRSNAGTLA